MKLIFPVGISRYTDGSGNTWTPGANGMLDIGSADQTPYLAAGFLTVPDNSGSTASIYDQTSGRALARPPNRIRRSRRSSGCTPRSLAS
jgi:hypothetical protein